MASMLPVAVYGLKVPAGDVMIPATVDFPATFRITMAAIDPSAKPEHTGTANGIVPPRATLKMVYDPSGPGDDNSDNSEEENYLQALLEGQESDGLSDEDDEDESSDDEDNNGGPSDPSKSKKARKEAAAQQLIKALVEKNEGDDSEGEMEVDESPKVNGVLAGAVASKGKGKAKIEDIERDEDEDDSESATDGMEEVVLCTLDPEKTYQQPIDITIPEDQPTYFKVSGTHAIYLSGNYVIPPDDGHEHEDEDDDDSDYDLSPDEDELDLENMDESDELDDLEDPRITELDSDDEKEAPKLVKKEEKKEHQPIKGKNKRQAEDSGEEVAESANLDDIMAKSLKPGASANGEVKLSKKQLKKLKNNAGKAVEAAIETKDVKKEDTATKGDKKVQFAKNLEQGPASSPSTVNKADTNGNVMMEPKKENEKSNNKATLGVKMVQGVKIDDKKLGKGPAAKKGDKLGMRYIGKLSDGRVFDANKKGPPFRFKLGASQVIQGWEIGIAGMSVEGERRIVIPASLGYGNKKQPGVPPNSELTFDIKLLEIN